MAGDELDDDYVLSNLEQLSAGSDVGDALAYDEELDGDVDLRDSAPVSGIKRRLSPGGEDDGAEVAEDTDEDDAAAAARAKKAPRKEDLTAEEKKKEKKRRNKEKLREKKKIRLAAPAPAPTAATDDVMDSEPSVSSTALLRTLRAAQRESLKSLSDLEWEDRALPETCLLNSSTSLASLVASLPAPVPSQSPGPGQPHFIILASSGQRCADLVRELRAILPQQDVPPAAGAGAKGKGKGKGKKTPNGAGEIAKLFAKHFKLADHIAYCKSTLISVAVGTPHRVSELLPDALHRPRYILFDLSHRDSKERSLLENLECRDSIWKGVFGEDALGPALGLAEGEAGRVMLGAF